MSANTVDSLSLTLTPAEIKNKEFKKTVMGYSPHEVIEFLEAIAKTWERVQKREKELLETIQNLTTKLRSWEDREAEIAKKREAAEQEAAEIRTHAEQNAQRFFEEVEERATNIRSRTEQWLETVIAKVEETERQKNNFMTAFKSALDSHYALLRSEEEANEPLGAQLTEILKGGEVPASTH